MRVYVATSTVEGHRVVTGQIMWPDLVWQSQGVTGRIMLRAVAVLVRLGLMLAGGKAM